MRRNVQSASSWCASSTESSKQPMLTQGYSRPPQHSLAAPATSPRRTKGSTSRIISRYRTCFYTVPGGAEDELNWVKRRCAYPNEAARVALVLKREAGSDAA